MGVSFVSPAQSGAGNTVVATTAFTIPFHVAVCSDVGARLAAAATSDATAGFCKAPSAGFKDFWDDDPFAGGSGATVSDFGAAIGPLAIGGVARLLAVMDALSALVSASNEAGSGGCDGCDA